MARHRSHTPRATARRTALPRILAGTHAPILAAALAALLLYAPLPLSAQAVELGVTAGLNHATVAWETSPLGSGFEELERRTAFTGGLTLGLRLGDRLGLRAELLHTGKGFREVEASGDETALDLAYLELPVLLGVRVPVDGPVEPELYAGPYLAREIACDLAAQAGGQELEFDCDELPGDEVLRQTTEWGGVVGVAVRVGNPSRPRIVFDVRYTRGLRNIDAAPEVDNLDIRHRGLAAMVGLSVPLGL